MLARNDYYLETKMDGERCQVHVNGTEFKYYSRGCKDDLTEVFGSTGRTGLFSPFFYGQLNRDVKNAIFDGEMMVWDNEENSMLKKSEYNIAYAWCFRSICSKFIDENNALRHISLYMNEITTQPKISPQNISKTTIKN